MRSIDRISLLEDIGRELQSRMTFSDIDIFFAGFGIDSRGITPSYNSKRVYAKEVLANASNETILKIADDLDIEHSYHSRIPTDEGKYWEAGHFRLFLSHISAFKEKTSLLQKSLRQFGISAFVAHEDIEPTMEWLLEIEKALFSMDALAAILTPGFNNSSWTDHEVGIAIGRDKLVIPIRKGLDPYGFIGKFQGVQGNGKTVPEVARAVFDALVANLKTRDVMIARLVDLVIFSTSEEQAIHRLTLMLELLAIPRQHLEKLRSNAQQQALFRDFDTVLTRTNELLRKHGLDAVALRQESTLTDEVPF